MPVARIIGTVVKKPVLPFFDSGVKWGVTPTPEISPPPHPRQSRYTPLWLSRGVFQKIVVITGKNRDFFGYHGPLSSGGVFCGYFRHFHNMYAI